MARDRRRPIVSGATILLPLLAGCAAPDLGKLERTLSARDSATAALGEWCRIRQIADPAAIRAERVERPAQPSAGIRRVLGVRDDEPLGYRHVRLACGRAVLSEADNWYVPSRLTAAMNAQLAETQIPFGTVAAPLGFRRERLSARRGQAKDCPAGTVLSHRALLRLPDGRPLSLLTECYTRANLTQASRKEKGREVSLPALP